MLQITGLRLSRFVGLTSIPGDTSELVLYCRSIYSCYATDTYIDFIDSMT